MIPVSSPEHLLNKTKDDDSLQKNMTDDPILLAEGESPLREERGMPTVWFIRHAESETDIGLPSATPLTVPLTPKGFEQAQLIARTFTIRPELVVTSSYARSYQTAIPTLHRFPDARHEEWAVHEFRYLAQSLNAEKTTLEDRRKHVDAYWSRLDPSYKDGEGAESFADFMNRAYQVLGQLKQHDEDAIAVFTHGQFILSVLSWLMGLSYDMLQFRYLLLANRIPNGAILKVSLQRGKRVSLSPFRISHLPSRTEATIR